MCQTVPFPSSLVPEPNPGGSVGCLEYPLPQSFQPVLHDWCNKGHGMYYPVLLDGAYKRTLAVKRKE